MGIAQSIPVRFTPRGLADAYDSTDVFPGACRKLSNLVFDQSNPEIVISRPGVGAGITSFAGFSSPGFISLQVTIGDRVYGMIATGLTTGYDEPFCFDLQTSSFIPISGVSSMNTEGRPASPSVSGAWNPPTLAVIGIKLIITHPGYTGFGSSFFGVIDITDPAVPTYVTINTLTFPLPSAPTAVANLNNRAYFQCRNELYYSDVLVPDTMTNAGQALTVGDSAPLVGLGGLPVQTTSAGVIAALLAFKGTQIWQITGDALGGTLALNYLSLTVGTTMPRSVVSTPLGVFFGGPDSAYIVSPNGAAMALTAQIGNAAIMPDIRQPFGFVTEPTRAAAAFSGNIYRICIPTIIDGLSGTFDYWFDIRKMRWTGPHSFAYDCASSAGGYFVLSGAGSRNKLFRSDPFRNVWTTYFDNGNAYNITVRSADLPKKDDMSMKQVIESTVELASSGGRMTYNVSAYDETSTRLAAATVTTRASGVLWGSNRWGDGSRWAAAVTQARTYPIDWQIPLVFNKLSLEISRAAGSNIAVGTVYVRMQKAGYELQDLPVWVDNNSVYQPSGWDPVVTLPTTWVPPAYPKALIIGSPSGLFAYRWSGSLGFGDAYPVGPANWVNSMTLPLSKAAIVIQDDGIPHSMTAYAWSNTDGFGNQYGAPPGDAKFHSCGKVSFSPNGNAVVLPGRSGYGAEFLAVTFNWSDAVGFTSRFITSGLPLYAYDAASISKNNESVAVPVDCPPGLLAYHWSSVTGFGGTYPAPSVVPSGLFALMTLFSPSGNQVATFSDDGTITVYQWNDITGIGALLSTASVAGYISEVAFSPTEGALVLAHEVAPYITAFHWNNSVGLGVAYPSPGILPPGQCYQVAFSPEGDALAVTYGTAPYLNVYAWNDVTGFLAKYSDPTVPLIDRPNGVSFT